MLPCRALETGIRSRVRLQARDGPRCSFVSQASRTRTYPGTRWQSVSNFSRSARVLKATGTDGTTSTASSSSSSSTDERIKTTMADLDALLGIQEEPAANEAKVTSCLTFDM